MGKSNSKLKAEVLEELTRKTYCEYHRTVVTWYQGGPWWRDCAVPANTVYITKYKQYTQ